MEELNRQRVGVVFDLDGTLVDTASDLHRAAAHMLHEAGRPELPLAIIRTFIGHGIAVLVERIVEASGLDPADLEHHTRVLVEDYNADPARLSKPFPGVTEALDRASGLPLGVCTNKPEYATREILSQLGMIEFFGAIVCGDTAPRRKPDPSGLMQAKDILEVDRLIYVGDSETDSETAHRAGETFLLFTEGYRFAPVAEIPHAASFDHFDALAGLLDRFLNEHSLSV